MIIRSALRDRVEGIPLHFNWSTIESGGEKGKRAAPPRLGRGKRHLFSGNHPLGRLGEGNEVGFGATTTRKAETRQSQGGPHQPQKSSTRKRIIFPLRCAFRKFAMKPLFEIRGAGILPKATPVGAAGGGCRGMLEDAFHGKISDGIRYS